jgi:hypothetical protein
MTKNITLGRQEAIETLDIWQLDEDKKPDTSTMTNDELADKLNELQSVSMGEHYEVK